MLTTHPFDDDKLREECGIFGIWGAETASAVVALGLHALQHRGQEAVGITSFDGQAFHSHRAMGHVAGNFDRDDVIRSLAGGALVVSDYSGFNGSGLVISADLQRAYPIDKSQLEIHYMLEGGCVTRITSVGDAARIR